MIDQHGKRQRPGHLDGGVLDLTDDARPARLVLGEVAHDVLGHDDSTVHNDAEVDRPQRQEIRRDPAEVHEMKAKRGTRGW
jgi:hypothetical protein